MIIYAQFGGTCLTCEERYAPGDQVNYQPGAGCWHLDCDAPKNLERYRKDAAIADRGIPKRSPTRKW